MQQTMNLESSADMPKAVQKFFDFHARNPEIYKQFKRFTKELLGSKPTRTIGSQMIIERIRYELFLNKQDEREEYKINNNYAPGYARLFVKDFPEYDGLIRLRGSIFDDYI